MLLRKLRNQEVLDAILAWAVQGAKIWMEDYERGDLMEVPEAVREEVEEYKQEENHVLQFVDEMIERTDDQKDRIPKPDLYGYYRAWCTETGRRQFHTSNKLSRELQSVGFNWKPAQVDGRVRDCWVGIQVRGALMPKQT